MAKTETTTVESTFKFGATEGIYLAGVALLFVGLWIWQGLGVALTVTGAALMVSALFNDWNMSRAAV